MPRLTRCLPLAPLALLAACASPIEKCIETATSEIGVLDHLIAETEGNIERGYAVEAENVPVSYFDWCAYGTTYVSWCQRTTIDTYDRPVTIDMGVERRKLRDLKAIRREKLPRAQVAIAQCHAQFPQS